MPMVLRVAPEPIRGVRGYSTFTPRRSFIGRGFLAGDPPDGLVTLNGITGVQNARIRVLWRDPNSPYYGVLVAETLTDVDGRWRVDGLNESLRYNVTVSKDGFNDRIMADVTPALGPCLIKRQVTARRGKPFLHALEVHGGSGSVQISVPNPASLPAGLSVENGIISGTPSAVVGEYRVLILLADSASERSDVLTLTVDVAPLCIGHLDLSQTGAVGVGLTPVTILAVGGVAPYTFSLIDPPAWISIGEETGVVNGTPVESGLFAITAQVEDAQGTKSRHTAWLTVS
jgi:hypothetical protein